MDTALLAYSVKSLCKEAQIGRTKLYAEIASGRLKAKKLGGKTVILSEDAQAWLKQLPAFRSGFR